MAIFSTARVNNSGYIFDRSLELICTLIGTILLFKVFVKDYNPFVIASSFIFFFMQAVIQLFLYKRVLGVNFDETSKELKFRQKNFWGNAEYLSVPFELLTIQILHPKKRTRQFQIEALAFLQSGKEVAIISPAHDGFTQHALKEICFAVVELDIPIFEN